MDVSRLERFYMALGITLMASYLFWTDTMGYSEEVFFLLLITLVVMSFLYVLFISHFEGRIEINFYSD